MKQMEVTKKKIGENTFYIKPFAAFTAANISGELSALIAPIISSLAPLAGSMDMRITKGKVEATGADVNIENISLDQAIPAITEAFSTLSGDRLERLMTRLLIQYRKVSVSGEITDGETVVLNRDLADEVFCGDIQDMFILCFEVIKVNFGGFFKKMADLSGGLPGVSTQTTNQENGENSTPSNSANSK